MKKLPKEKRNYLIAVGMGTLLAVVGLWFLLIAPQQSKLQELSARITDAQEKLEIMRKAAEGSLKVAAELEMSGKRLAVMEEDMPAGDLYSWVIDTVKRFKVSHNVDIPQFGQVTIGDVSLFPIFPYRQVSLGVTGTAYYQEFGRFLADFENRFTTMRIQNLELEPLAALSPADKEKLSFRMEIVMLVKPTS
jgi:hypothetical protein